MISVVGKEEQQLHITCDITPRPTVWMAYLCSEKCGARFSSMDGI